MRWSLAAAVAVTLGGQAPALEVVMARAATYMAEYERQFALLVSEEHSVQEVRRPLNPGANLSRANPGGGMQGGDVRSRRVLRADYLLVALGEGRGWMPFRDVFSVDGRELRDRQERLTRLFLEPGGGFDPAARIMEESTRYNLGNITRTVNIPTLALLFAKADIAPRFAFEAGGEAEVAGRTVREVRYRETARPTLTRTSRGRELVLTGRLWIDPADGTIVKTHLVAADPIVRAEVTVTFREDADLGFWVPVLMEEYYKATRDLDEIYATATYSNVRRFQVSTTERVGKPPGDHP